MQQHLHAAGADALMAVQAALVGSLPVLLQHLPEAVRIETLPLLQAAVQAAAGAGEGEGCSSSIRRCHLLSTMLTMLDAPGADARKVCFMTICLDAYTLPVPWGMLVSFHAILFAFQPVLGPSPGPPPC